MSAQEPNVTIRAANVLRALGLGSTNVRHILLATEGLDDPGRAADVAAKLARITGAELSILIVGRDASAGEVGASAEAQSNVEQILQNAKERALRAGVSDVRAEFGRGDPATVIIESAQREKVDVIVIDRRDRGLVSQKVASLAPCIVIVVPSTEAGALIGDGRIDQDGAIAASSSPTGKSDRAFARTARAPGRSPRKV